MEVLSVSTEKTKELARILAPKLKAGDIVALYGDLGTGKTAFTSYLVEALSIPSRVQSPTFVLSRRYANKDNIEAQNSLKVLSVHHLDLYRLQSEKEVEDIGLLDMIEEPNSISIIEWPEHAEKLLPKERTVKIFFQYGDNENERKITIQNLH